MSKVTFIKIRYFLLSPEGKRFIKYFESKIQELGNQTCKERAWTYVLLFKAYTFLADDWKCDTDFAEWKLKPEILEEKPENIYKSILEWAMFDDYATNILSTNDDDAFNERLGLFDKWLIDKPWQLDPFELKLPNK